MVTTDESIIQVRNVTKVYGSVVVLHDLNLDVKRGEIYGFLGPNGSGKSTTIMILTGIEKPSSGSYELFGNPCNGRGSELWRRIGIVTEHQYLYENMTPFEYLSFFANLYAVRDARRLIMEWLDRIGLVKRKNVRLAHLSNGERQKLCVARALIHDPDLLILDEPVQGLDPLGVRDLRNLLKELNGQGKTIFLSSHILSEVAKTADRVGILHKGTLFAEDRMDVIRARLDQGKAYQIEVLNLSDEVLAALKRLPGVQIVQVEGQILHLQVSAEEDRRDDISKSIVQHGGSIVGWAKKEISLEEAYMAITEREISLLSER